MVLNRVLYINYTAPAIDPVLGLAIRLLAHVARTPHAGNQAIMGAAKRDSLLPKQLLLLIFNLCAHSWKHEIDAERKDL